MKLDITDHHFIELQKKGYTVDMVLLLSWINKGLSLDHIIKGSKKIEVIYKSLKRKGLITDTGKLAKPGMEILDFVSKKTNKTFIKPKVATSDFDEWWSIFPSTDIFEYKGRKFQGTRSLRTGKERCRLLFNKMIMDKKYTKDEIIKATLYDVNHKKKNSYNTGANKLTFLQNSQTYLYNESFEPFIKFGDTPDEVVTSKKGSIDI